MLAATVIIIMLLHFEVIVMLQYFEVNVSLVLYNCIWLMSVVWLCIDLPGYSCVS
jgi:hypothetical protein